MATIAFAAVGSAVGSSLLGGIFGTAAGAAVGRFAGSLLGRAVDQRIFGTAAEGESFARVAATRPADKMRVTGSYVGESIPSVYGRARISGQIIWAKQVQAEQFSNGSYKYTASFAVAICEGEVSNIGRVWANRRQVYLDSSNFRFYRGENQQEPDPLITQSVGADNAPGYNGTCYVVFENLDLAPYNNSIPNFEFEVFRKSAALAVPEASDLIRGVCLIPGTGEYALSADKVSFDLGFGRTQLANVARGNRKTNIENSIEQLSSELPNLDSVSLIVSWFGDDLRCDQCTVRPKVEQSTFEAAAAWNVANAQRGEAFVVSSTDGSPNYGGTPTDRSVVSAIQLIKQHQKSIMFYPFILMDIPQQNGLSNPWSNEANQPAFPWRGRITLPVAPGKEGSIDRTAGARTAVEKFLGRASIDDFQIEDGDLIYSGPDEWSYRRFILHYANLCKLAGGVDEFLIGTELRGLTSIRDEAEKFPFVEGLIALAKDVKEILGATTKISYAADWSEYFGYQPQHEPGAIYFNLDPLWSLDEIDFIGIDNYMPLSDWRDHEGHLDEPFGTPYSIDYLQKNIEAGEGFEWYYSNDSDRASQRRTPITDGEHEEWVWRFKDLRSWWNRPHYDRPNGVRNLEPTAWVPQSKPIYFTEYGAAAIDKSTNQPNKFLDRLSSESQLPYFSNGSQDDFIQHQYICALNQYWQEDSSNIVDVNKCYAWAWDARPWPEFPSRSDLWSDAPNFQYGHWLNGRVFLPTLANVVAEICAEVGIENVEVSALRGQVTSLVFLGDESVREKLETLMRAYLFDASVCNGVLCFKHIDDFETHQLDDSVLVEGLKGIQTTVESATNRFGSIEINYVDSEKDYLPETAVVSYPLHGSRDRASINMPLGLSEKFAKKLSVYYLTQSRKGEERITFHCWLDEDVLSVGDCVTFENIKGSKLYKIDKISRGAYLEVEAFLFEPEIARELGGTVKKTDNVPDVATEIWAEFLDIPYGNEAGFYVSLSAQNWGGEVKIFEEDEEIQNELLTRAIPSTAGSTSNKLTMGSQFVRQPTYLDIELTNGNLQLGGKFATHPIIAISHENHPWELIGFESVESLGNQNYRIEGLYRGLHGTESHIRTWPEKSKVVVLDSQITFIPNRDLLVKNDHNFLVVPNADMSLAGHYVKNTPIRFNQPYAPCMLKIDREDTETILTFVPRSTLDRDYWVNLPESYSWPVSYEVSAEANGQEIFTQITDSTRVLLGDITGDLLIKIRAVSEQGIKSNLIEEEFYV